jgi:hypothetical protein
MDRFRQYERDHLDHQLGNTSLVMHGAGRLCGDVRRSIRIIDLVYGKILLLMIVHLNSMTMVRTMTVLRPINKTLNSMTIIGPTMDPRPINATLNSMTIVSPTMDQRPIKATVNNMTKVSTATVPPKQIKATLDLQSSAKPVRKEVPTGPLKPWQSTPPTPIAFFNTTHDFIRQRHTCIQAVRDRQKNIFEGLLGDDTNLQLLLVDPAYHSNVGDHMLTLGELSLIQTTLNRAAPQQCHYRQAAKFVTACSDLIPASARDAAKVALWHAGGNWGDLWRGMSGAGLVVVVVHIFPRSAYGYSLSFRSVTRCPDILVQNDPRKPIQIHWVATVPLLLE